MIAEKIVAWLCRARYFEFQKALEDPQKVQLSLRNQLFHSLKKSKYGRSLGVKCWEEIPIVSYQDIEKWIKDNELTYSPVAFHLETSGSSSCTKMIPYTKEFKNSFLSLFQIWAYDLLKFQLKPEIGKIFMSLSPPGDSGLKDDTQFLNILLKKLLYPYLIFPPKEVNNYIEKTAQLLLSEKDLGIISVWNPTFLHQILECIEKDSPSPVDWKIIWPRLQLISCWTDGWAFEQAQCLKKKFHHVAIQGKGLLATEAPMSVPFHNAETPLPLINEVYFEFEDSIGNIFELEKVILGETYELIISQKGGLIRYRIGDKIQITGKYLNTPCFKFLGRVGEVCDMVGEKLDLITVEEILKEMNQSGTSILLPIYRPDKLCFYLLLTEVLDVDLANRLEEGLKKSFHYRVARINGQLDLSKVFKVESLLSNYHRFYRNEGMNWGDIKDTVFISNPLQAKKFLQQEYPILFGQFFGNFS
jgi:hypothetical protein